MYLKVGFVPCEPFSIYTINPYSVCMTLEPIPPRHQARAMSQGDALSKWQSTLTLRGSGELVRDSAHPHEQVGTV